MTQLRQKYTRARVRQLAEEDGEWGSTKKSWQPVGHASTRIQKILGLQATEGDRRLERMGAEYDADWFALMRAKPEIQQGWLLETLDSNDDAVTRMIVQKVLPRGRKVGVLLKENPNIQE